MLYFLNRIFKGYLVAGLLCVSVVSDAESYSSIVDGIESRVEQDRSKFEELIADNQRDSLKHAQSYDAIVGDIEARTEKDKAHYKALITANQKESLKYEPEIKVAVKQAESAFKKHAQTFKIDKKDKGSIIDQIVQNVNNLNAQKQASKSKGLVVFVSFSMPKSLLLSYHKQVQLYGGRLVIRGLVENSFKKTVATMMDFGKGQIPIIDINPKLFRDHKVTRVPTILLNHKGKIDKFTGSVSLKYALDEASQKGDCGKFAADILAKANNQSKERT